MRIPCEDPATGGPEESPLPAISTCHMLPTLAAAPAFALCLARYGPQELARDKAVSVMCVDTRANRAAAAAAAFGIHTHRLTGPYPPFPILYVYRNALAAVYRRRGCERLKRMVENLAHGLGADFEDLVRPRTEAEVAAEEAGMATHFPMELFSPTLTGADAMHPYALDLYKTPFVSMAAVVIGGQERVFANDAWARAFFGAEEAQRRLQEEGQRPEEIFGSVVHPDDRAFVVPMVDNCFFGTADTLCESTHIFRVRACD